MKKVTVIGGGTGTFVVLQALKDYPLDLGVIVTMMDSGGSTGRLRDQLGVLPPGDLRQCLVALSEAPQLWRKLFLYRFENGDLGGHNFGNVFISALEKVCKNYDEVIKTASYVLKTKGEVIPVTFEKTHLAVKYEDDRILKGEANIEANRDEKNKIKNAFLDPQASANTKALERLSQSDYIIVGPGDLYTSIIPVLLVDKVKEIIAKCRAKIIFVLNLMTKSGQTTDYTASDHLKDLKKYLGETADFVLVNTAKIPQDILQWYSHHNETSVTDDLSRKDGFKVITGNLIENNKTEKTSSDRLSRSILRHSFRKIAKILTKIIKC